MKDINEYAIGIGKNRWLVPQQWSDLTTKQALTLYRAISVVRPGWPVYYYYQMRLLCLLPKYARWLLYLKARPEDWLDSRVLTLWAEDVPRPGYAQLPRFRRKQPVVLDKLSFGQFISIESALAKGDSATLAGVLYGLPARRMAGQKALCELCWWVYYHWRNKVAKKFNHAFGSGGKAVPRHQVGESWTEILLSLAEKSIHMQQYAQLPALTVLFELNIKVKEAKELANK